jgi:hypothetical protein
MPPTETAESDISIWASGDFSIWRLQFRFADPLLWNFAETKKTPRKLPKSRQRNLRRNQNSQPDGRLSERKTAAKKAAKKKKAKR